MGCELLPQQLEVNHHRVQRILHLAGDAGRQPSERRELPRIAQRRLDLAEILQVARDEHDADEIALRIVDGVRHHQPLVRLRFLAPLDRYGPARLTVDERLLGELPHRVIARQQVVDRCADRDIWQERPHRRIGEQQQAAGVENRHGVLEMLDRELEIGDLSRHLGSIGGQLLADRVEEGAELAELVLLIQVQPHAEFAATESREAASDHMDRTQQQLRQQRRDQDGDGQRRERGRDGGAQREAQLIADEQRRDADPDRPELRIARRKHERLPELEILSLP